MSTDASNKPTGGVKQSWLAKEFGSSNLDSISKFFTHSAKKNRENAKATEALCQLQSAGVLGYRNPHIKVDKIPGSDTELMRTIDYHRNDASSVSITTPLLPCDMDLFGVMTYNPRVFLVDIADMGADAPKDIRTVSDEEYVKLLTISEDSSLVSRHGKCERIVAYNFGKSFHEIWKREYKSCFNISSPPNYHYPIPTKRFIDPSGAPPIMQVLPTITFAANQMVVEKVIDVKSMLENGGYHGVEYIIHLCTKLHIDNIAYGAKVDIRLEGLSPMDHTKYEPLHHSCGDYLEYATSKNSNGRCYIKATHANETHIITKLDKHKQSANFGRALCVSANAVNFELGNLNNTDKFTWNASVIDINNKPQTVQIECYKLIIYDYHKDPSNCKTYLPWMFSFLRSDMFQDLRNYNFTDQSLLEFNTSNILNEFPSAQDTERIKGGSGHHMVFVPVKLFKYHIGKFFHHYNMNDVIVPVNDRSLKLVITRMHNTSTSFNIDVSLDIAFDFWNASFITNISNNNIHQHPVKQQAILFDSLSKEYSGATYHPLKHFVDSHVQRSSSSLSDLPSGIGF